MSCKVTVEAGVCKMKTVIDADMDYETGKIKLVIESDCAMIRALGEKLPEIDYMAEVGGPLNESSIYKAAGECIKHLSCPVPCGICKAGEVAAGMGLKRNVAITIQ